MPNPVYITDAIRVKLRDWGVLPEGHNGGPLDAEHLLALVVDIGTYLEAACRTSYATLDDERLKAPHRTVLKTVIDAVGVSRPDAGLSRRSIATETGYSEHTVKTAIGDLLRWGYLASTQRGPHGGGRPIAHYALACPADRDAAITSALRAYETDRDAMRSAHASVGWVDPSTIASGSKLGLINSSGGGVLPSPTRGTNRSGGGLLPPPTSPGGGVLPPPTRGTNRSGGGVLPSPTSGRRGDETTTAATELNSVLLYCEKSSSKKNNTTPPPPESDAAHGGLIKGGGGGDLTHEMTAWIMTVIPGHSDGSARATLESTILAYGEAVTLSAYRAALAKAATGLLPKPWNYFNGVARKMLVDAKTAGNLPPRQASSPRQAAMDRLSAIVAEQKRQQSEGRT